MLTGLEGQTQFFYKVDVPSSNQEGNLVVKLLTSDEFSDPDLFLSFSNEEPNSPGGSDIMCASQGSDTCTVSSSRLNEGDIRTVFVGVVCHANCRYRIHPTFETVISLSNNVEMRLDF